VTELRYGDDRTIHRTTVVNVELDRRGEVVAVWFRCHPVPFTQDVVEDLRAAEMRRMYETPMKPLRALVFEADGRECAVIGCGQPDVVDPAAVGTWPTYSRMPLCQAHLRLAEASVEAEAGRTITVE
jgi:hypothetical protein